MKLIGVFEDKQDNVQKYVFKDNLGTIEVSRINTKEDRDIYCVPSMYMCNLGCTFCHLTTEDIPGKATKIDVETIIKVLGQIPQIKPKRQISIMGVGDPALNQELVRALAAREELVSIATIFPDKLKGIPANVKVHFSLHSTNSLNRRQMIPTSTLEIRDYLESLSKHRGKKEIHYTLIKDTNDSPEELESLVNYSTEFRIPIKFLKFNETGGMKESPKLEEWLHTLASVVPVETYRSPGIQIGSSCGAFTKHFYTKDGIDSPEYKEYAKNFKI